MLIYDVRSWNVYENKGNMDTMTAKKSDIYGNLTWILQKNSESDGQFSLIDTIRAVFVPYSRRKSPPVKVEEAWRGRDRTPRTLNIYEKSGS